MNVNTERMQECVNFLEEHSLMIQNLCTALQENIIVAMQVLDQQSARDVAMRIGNQLETIKRNVPTEGEAAKKLILAKQLVETASSGFGR